MRTVLTFTSILLIAYGCANLGGGRIDGRDLALKSTGAAVDGGGWKLDESGYLGTYLRLDRPATVSVNVRASGDAATLGVSAADLRQTFPVESASTDCDARFPLSAGTHFLHIECRGTVVVRSVSVRGAQVMNEHTDANALAAADSYVEHFRKGPARVTLTGVEPGTSVHVKLRRHAFNFGTNATGTRNQYLIENPPPESDAARWQAFVNAHFNCLVPSNAGKWAYNEPSPGQIDMEYVDEILAYAEKHGLRARMHAMLWDTPQQPQWVRDLMTRADTGDADAKRELRAAIDRRIDYYVKQRASRYVELDVLNESVHHARYNRIFGGEGIASIFKRVHDAAPDPKRFLNEFNVMQWSRGAGSQVDDPYANWYRRHVEEINRAGGDEPAVTGIGVQYYVGTNERVKKRWPHSAARIQQVMQNLAGTGCSISLTEYATQGATPEESARILDETMRMMFGTPQANTFMIWGFWAGAVTPKDVSTALVDKDWNLTPAGHAYERLMAKWNTDETLTVANDATITFTGFFGDYDVTIGDDDRHATFELRKGQTDYTIDR